MQQGVVPLDQNHNMQMAMAKAKAGFH